MNLYHVYGHTLASDFNFITPMLEGTSPIDLTFTQVLDAPIDPIWQDQDPIINFETVQLYTCDGYDVLHALDVVDFYIYSDKIIAHLLDADYDYQVEVLFMGLVWSYWLEKRGVRAFHAAAVQINGGAVAFLSTNKGGKSSLAATLTRMGHALLTDDILPVIQQESDYIAYPSFPQMRMWPSEADHFIGHHEDLILAHPAYDKRRVPTSLIGEFCQQETPLERLYLPTRLDDVDAPVTIQRLPAGQAMMDLLTNSFAISLVEYGALQQERFHSLGQLVQSIPVYSLSYPSGLDKLQDVCQAILQHTVPSP